MENIKNKMSKKVKLIITFIVLIAVVISGIIIVKSNQNYFYTRALYMLMPKTITGQEMGTDYDLSVGLNGEYDAKKKSSYPLEAFEYYYTDPQTGEDKVVKGTENASINGEEVPVYLGFLIEAKTNLENLKSVLSKTAIVLVLIIIVGGIILWYKVWSKKEEQQKERKYKNSHNKHKSANK